MTVFTIDDIIAIAILAVIGVLLLATLVKEWASSFLDWLKDVFGRTGRRNITKSTTQG